MHYQSGKVMRRILSIMTLLAFLSGQTISYASLPEDVDTSKLPPNGGEHYNRLIFEKSPYLLLHAANPIDWFPWSEEAFEKARREGKPIFLSIGYSTCHWCHVMEDESFADAVVAEILNRAFVSIKVDREERPDIDQVYMTVSRMLTGGGGWPLTILMTPEKKPFFAGTYIPKEARFGRQGLLELLTRVEELWKGERKRVVDSAEGIAEALSRVGAPGTGRIPGREVLAAAYKSLEGSYDEKYGGFGRAPKFPRPHVFQFLLRYGLREEKSRAVEMTRVSLTSLRRGGIYDQLGYGFHRYSTDRTFLTPHFEKMLYDQALLALAYLEAYQVTGEELFADTAGEIFTYVLRDMTSAEGGFFSAEDADSEGEEGKFYLWSYDEILKVIGTKEGRLLADIFNARPEGNYREEASGEPAGRNILHLGRNPPAGDAFQRNRDLLFRHRRHRIPPLRDDKVLTSWNGLMVAALARGGSVLGEERSTKAAEKAARLILDRMRAEDGRLLRRYRQGEAALPAYLDDYAFLVYGLIELYEATFDTRYLSGAKELNGEMIELFWDGEHGGLLFSGAGNERLILDLKESYDGATPSGNSVALFNLLRLARLTGDAALEKKAEELLLAFGQALENAPAGHTMMLTAFDFLRGPTKEIVIVGRPDDRSTRKMLGEVRKGFRPNQVVLLRPPGEEGADLVRLAPYTEYMKMQGGKATAYICVNYTCKSPITDLETLREKLR